MKLKQYDRYVVDFNSKWATSCAALLGVSLFVRVIYYFALVSIADCNIFQILFDMVAGIGLTVAFLVMFTAMRRNVPGVYALMGAGFSLLLAFNSFYSGDVLRIILALHIYLLAAFVLIITISGYLPGKIFSAAAFLIPAVVRVALVLSVIVSILSYIGMGILSTVDSLVGLPGFLVDVISFLLSATVWVLNVNLEKINLFTWVIEGSWWLILAAMFCFTLALKPYRRNEDK